MKGQKKIKPWIILVNHRYDIKIRNETNYLKSNKLTKCLKDLEGSFRYPLAREGVYATGGPALLAHARQNSTILWA